MHYVSNLPRLLRWRFDPGEERNVLSKVSDKRVAKQLDTVALAVAVLIDSSHLMADEGGADVFIDQRLLQVVYEGVAHRVKVRGLQRCHPARFA